MHTETGTDYCTDFTLETVLGTNCDPQPEDHIFCGYRAAGAGQEEQQQDLSSIRV